MNVSRLLQAHVKFELRKLVRMPVYLITLLGLPLFFYLATGTNQRLPELTEGIATEKYLICTLGTFGVFGIALFGFGVNYAIERSQGWYHTLQATPVPVWLIFTSKIISCLFVAALALLLLFFEALLVFNVSMPPGEWLGIFFTLLLGVIPLASMGLLIGSLFGSNSVSLVTIMVYLGVSSLSGLLATLSMIRKGNPDLADWAVVYPTYHVSQLALSNLRETGATSIIEHTGYLLLYTGMFSLAALILFRKRMHTTHG